MAVDKFEDLCLKPFLLTIDGPISAGKTTLGFALMQRSSGKVKFLAEDGHDDGIVDIFLKNPEKYAAVFQMLMHGLCYGRHELAITRIEQCKKQSICIIDRSLIGNMIFAVTNHRLRNIDDGSYMMYKKQSERMRKNLRRDSNLNVYLWVKPKTCIQRNLERNSLVETSTSYLECQKYDYFYFWEVEKSAFVALLSDLSSGHGTRRPLIVDWHESNFDQAIANFNRIISDYLKSGDSHTMSITLSYNEPCSLRNYTHTFDYSHLKSVDDFFSPDVITSVMDTIAFTTTYSGMRIIHMRVPKCLTSTNYSDLFTLNIQ